MPKPCTVCSHLDRGEIDRLLGRQMVNVAEVARTYGVSVDACHRHRSRHLPDFLPAFQATAVAPTMSKLHAEYQRLHAIALDELARAQSGTLHDVGKDGSEVRTISATAVARALDNVRKTLGDLVHLAADAAPPDEAPMGQTTGELMGRIRDQLKRVEARAEVNTYAPERIAIEPTVHDDAVEDAELRVHLAEQYRRPEPSPPGGQAGSAPTPLPSPIPLDAVIPPKTPLVQSGPDEEMLNRLSPKVAATLRQDFHSKQEAQPAYENTPLLSIPNPGWPGSQAATTEERTAAGWPDVVITWEDVRANAHLLAHRPSPSPEASDQLPEPQDRSE